MFATVFSSTNSVHTVCPRSLECFYLAKLSSVPTDRLTLSLCVVSFPDHATNTECFPWVKPINLISILRPISRSRISRPVWGADSLCHEYSSLALILLTNACPQHSSWAPAVYGIVICTTEPVRNENNNQLLRCLQDSWPMAHVI